MKNGQVEEKDLLAAYMRLYETTGEPYRSNLIWWLDVNSPAIAAKVREKLGITLIRSPRL